MKNRAMDSPSAACGTKGEITNLMGIISYRPVKS